jgi:dTDP-4-dehydrorhamnose reductase
MVDKKPRILITGANGQLGSELRELSSQFGNLEYVFTDVAELNITKIKDLEAFFLSEKFDYVVNCAAYTAVDKAESDKETAFLLNTIAVDLLIEMAQRFKFLLIHISTDYVFDGTKNRPYSEEDVTIPSSAYGETKCEAEKLIMFSDINSIIIRTSWLYSTYGNNFVKTMLRLGHERDELNIVFDQVGSPTYARDLAKAILHIIPQLGQINKPFREIYHFSDEGVCSWYDFTKHIFKIRGIGCKVNPIKTKEYPTPASRPAFSVFDKSKIKKHFNVQIPYWVDSLEEMLGRLK